MEGKQAEDISWPIIAAFRPPGERTTATMIATLLFALGRTSERRREES